MLGAGSETATHWLVRGLKNPDKFHKYAGMATAAATRTYYKANKEKIDNQIKAGRREAQKRIGTKARGLTSSLRK